MDEAGTGGVECSRKVASGREEGCRCHHVPSNARDLKLECARVLHEKLLVSVLIYGSDSDEHGEDSASTDKRSVL